MKIPQKTKNRSTMWLAIPLLGIYPKDWLQHITEMATLPVYCNTIHNSQDTESPQEASNVWVDKENVLYTQNGIVPGYKNEILIFATKWMDLGGAFW